MNVNYLIVAALKHYEYSAASAETRRICAETYTKLRDNLIENVFGEYFRTGYLWEQYDGDSGSGIRGHPFTGWTALITNILTENYK